MMSRTITNNVPRPLIDASELTERDREDFDYLDWPAIDEGSDSATFFRYRGQLYSLDQFTRGGPGAEWDGYASDSAFSAVAIRLVPGDTDRIIVGTIPA